MDTSALSPADAVVALRSFPRRYREATALEPGDNDRRLYHTGGIVGRTVMDLAVETVRTISLIQRALEDVLTVDKPPLHTAVLTRRFRDFDTVAHGDVPDVLDELDDVAPAFAERITRVATDDWTRTGTPVGATPVTALELVQEAVSTAADNLRDIEVTMRQLRGS